MLAVAEAAIPPWFPSLSAVALGAFPRMDGSFFERHGPRDSDHSEDAAVLFSLYADPDWHGVTRANATRDIANRLALLDEWAARYTVSQRSRPPLFFLPGCKGQGGCKVEGSHDCKGQNECKGKGGCSTM